MKNPYYRFDEVLTDGYSCLLVGDVQTLLDFQRINDLPADLQTAFTTTTAGDEVVAQGAMLYLDGVQNPYGEGYTLLFSLDGESRMAKAGDSKIVHRVPGYLLHVTSGEICTYTWPWLKDFGTQAAGRLYELSATGENPVRQRLPLVAGYYGVEVLCGYVDTDTPAFEFVLRPTQQTEIAEGLGELMSHSYSLT